MGFSVPGSTSGAIGAGMTPAEQAAQIRSTAMSYVAQQNAAAEDQADWTQ